MRQAVSKANSLRVPLIVAGDLHDTKAQHRAECQEAMLSTFSQCWESPIVLVGNHCRRNEKSPEHSLHFLGSVARIVDRPVTTRQYGFTAQLIPYQHSAEDFKKALDPGVPLVICHQGIIGADMGHYVQDKSAITKEDVAGYRVISGHYHRRQDIKCGRPRKGAVGLFSYIGNPYTLTFAEAKDPAKGYQILMDDGTLEFVPTNLRKHIVWEIAYPDLRHYVKSMPPYVCPEDLVWIKITGSPSELAALSKETLGQQLLGHSNYRLEKISVQAAEEIKRTPNSGPAELMDALIDKTEGGETERAALKKLWRGLQCAY